MFGRVTYIEESLRYARRRFPASGLTERHAEALKDLASEILEDLHDRATGQVPHLKPITRKCVALTAPEFRISSAGGVR